MIGVSPSTTDQSFSNEDMVKRKRGFLSEFSWISILLAIA